LLPSDALRHGRSLLTAAFLAATFSTPAFAQSIDTTNIGAINMSYVARMSRAGKEGLARIDEASRRKALEVETWGAALQKQQADFQVSSTGLSERAITALQRTFEKSRLEFDRLKQDAQKEIETMQRLDDGK
jgi:Skp family chaperone for outer membrane proteins